mgnify:CR=1 FL=1
MASGNACIEVEDLTLAYGEEVTLRGLSFQVRCGDVFVIMGPSGSGKSTVLRALVGLKKPASGRVLYDGVSLWDADPDGRRRVQRRIGVSFQSGALFSALTLAENVALPLEQFTDMPRSQVRDLAALKLALVGLAGFEGYYPAQISGGMRKRAALARAMALDPDVLFFDEPSAGLDPVNARRLDDLIMELRDSLGTTIVMVSHELARIFTIGNRAVLLDSEARTIIAAGDPRTLREESQDPRVRAFLTRGEEGGGRAR